MANSDWVDGADLAGMSRGGNVLQQMGYDPEEVRANPAMRADLMSKIASPYSSTTAPKPAQAPVQVAQNVIPPRPGAPALNPRSQNGNDITQPAGTPQLVNRQQPTVTPPTPTPAPKPVPDTLGQAASAQPTQQSMAGGAAPTSSSVSPSGTPAPSNSIEIENERKAVAKLLADEPTPPDDPALASRISLESIPHNPEGQGYAPSGWQKFGRGLKSAAVGLAVGGIPGAAVGAAAPQRIAGGTAYDAPNSKYAVDEAQRVAQLGADQKTQADAIARFKQAADLRKQQDTASKDAGEISNTAAKLPNETTIANSDLARAQEAGAPNTLDKAIAAFNSETDPAKRTVLGNTVKQMMDDQMKLKPPRQPGERPSAETLIYEDRKAAAVRENGGKPLTSAQLIALGGGGRIDPNTPDEVSSIVADAMEKKQKFADQYQRQDDGSYMDPTSGKTLSAQQFQDQVDQLGRSEPNTKLARKGYHIDDTGQIVNSRAAALQANPTAPAPPRVGEVKKGYRYLGGDLSDPASWKKVGK